MGHSIPSLNQFGQLYDPIKNSLIQKLLFGKIENFKKKWNVFKDSVGNLGFPLQNPKKQDRCILKWVIQVEQLKKICHNAHSWFQVMLLHASI